MAKKTTHYSAFKSLFLLMALVAFNVGTHAQVGIGTPMPDPSSQLDIVADDRGILIPRVALSSTFDDTTISSGNVESLLVYNTASTNDVTPGYYYWAKDHWARLINDSDVQDANTINQQLATQNNALVLRDNHGGTVQVALRDLQILTNLRDNGDGTISYFNEYGQEQRMNIASMVKGHETLTFLVENADGTLTYTDEYNQSHVIPLPDLIAEHEDLTQISVNVDQGTLTYIDEDGNSTVINIADLIERHETLTRVEENGDGTFTYYDEHGQLTVIDANTVKWEEVSEGVFELNNKNGSQLIIDTKADNSVYIDPEGNQTTVEVALNEVWEVINNHNTLINNVTLVDNGDGTFNYTDQEGNTITFNANTGEFEEINPGIYEFRDQEGYTFRIDTNADTSVYINPEGDVTTVELALDDIYNILNQNSEELGRVDLVDYRNGYVTLIKPDGTSARVAKSGITSDGNGIYNFSNGNPEDAVQIDVKTTTFTDNGDGTYTFTDLFGDDVTIDTNASAINFKTIEGDNISVQNALTQIFNDLSTTENELNTIELVDNGNGTFNYTDKDGNTITFDANTGEFEEVTPGVYVFADQNGYTFRIDTNADTAVYIDPDGDVTTVEVALDEILEIINNHNTQLDNVQLVDNGNGTFDYTDQEGNTITFDANTGEFEEVTPGVYEFTDQNGYFFRIDTNADTAVYIDPDGDVTTVEVALDEILEIINNHNTQLDNVQLVDNGNGTFDYTDQEGNTITFDANTGEFEEVTPGVYEFTDQNGYFFRIDTNADTAVYIDPDGDVTTVEVALDEILEIINNHNTQLDNVQLVDNGNGTFDYTDQEGNTITFDANTGRFEEVEDGIYEFTDQNGYIFHIDTNADTAVYINPDGDVTTVEVALDEILEIINNHNTQLDNVQLVDNGNGTFDYTDQEGNTITFDANTGEFEEVTPGVYEFTDQNGYFFRIDTNADTAVYINPDGDVTTVEVALDEITEIINNHNTQLDNIQLVDNDNGTFTYTDQEGSTITFDANTGRFEEVEDGIYKFTDQNGYIFHIDTNADTAVYINPDGDVTTVEVALDEILEIINNHNTQLDNVQLVDKGNGTFDYTDQDGNTITFDANTGRFEEVEDGVYEFTNQNGYIFHIDTNADTAVYINPDGDVTTVEVALDEILEIINNHNTQLDNVQLVDKGNGTFDYTDQDGNTITFDANTGRFEEVEDGVYEFTNQNGYIFHIDTNADTAVYIDQDGDFTTVELALDDIYNILNQNAEELGRVDLIDYNNGYVTLIKPDGTSARVAKSGITSDGNGIYNFSNGNPEDAVQIDVKTTSFADNGDGTYTFTDLFGDDVTIDTNASAINFETIEGDNISVQNALTQIFNDLSVTENELNTIELVDNGNGTFNYTDKDGNTITFDANTGEFEEVEPGIYVFSDQDGYTFRINTNADTAVYINPDGDITTVEVALDEIIEIINNHNTQLDNVQLVDNGNGTFDYTDQEGNTITFDANTGRFQEVEDGVYVFTDQNGYTFQIDTNADTAVYIDQDGNETTVQVALDEITEIINNHNTQLDNIQLVDNGNGTFDYTDQEGNTITFDANTGEFEEVEPGIYVFSDQDGYTFRINTNADTAVYIDQEGNETTVQVALDEITEIINNHNTQLDNIQLVDNENGTFTYTDQEGNTITFDANTGRFEEVEPGIYVFSDQDGYTFRINTNADTAVYIDQEGNETTVQVALDEITEIINNHNTQLDNIQLVDNENGTFTYTDQEGNTITFDANTGRFEEVEDGVYVFTDQNGYIFHIDTNADTAVYINPDGDITTVEVTLDEITEIINNHNTQLDFIELVDNGNGTFTYTDQEGNTITFDANTGEFEEVEPGIYEFSDQDGYTFRINTNADTAVYIDQDGNETTVQVALEEITEIINNHNTQLDNIQLVDNENGTFTYTDQEGNTLTFDANTGRFEEVEDGIYEFTDQNGYLFRIDTNADTAVYINPDGDITTVEVALDEITEIINNHNTQLDNIQLVDNDNGTFTYTDQEGNTITFDANTGEFDEVTPGVYVFADKDGYTFQIDTNADTAIYINPDGDITTVEVALDEITEIINNHNTQLDNIQLVDNDNGTFTYTDQEGNTLTFDANTGRFEEVEDGIYEFTDQKGYLFRIDTNADTAVYIDQDGNETTVQVALDEITEIINNHNTQLDNIQLVDNDNGTFTYTDQEGKTTTFDANTGKFEEVTPGVYEFADQNGYTFQIDANTITIVEDEITGTYIVSDRTGEIATIETAASTNLFDDSLSNLGVTNVQDAIDALQTNTNAELDAITLTDKGDGTFALMRGTLEVAVIDKADMTLNDNGTYTFDNNGKSVTFDPYLVKVTANDDGTYDFQNATGDVIATIETAASTNLFDDSVSNLGVTNVQDAIDALQTNTNAELDAITLTDKGDGTFALMRGTLEVAVIDKADMTLNDNGTYTFDNNGKSVTFDPYLVKVTANDDGTYDFQNATGDVIATIETAASTNLFDDSVSNLGVTNVQDAIDALQTNTNAELDAITLTDKGDGTFALMRGTLEVAVIDKADMTLNDNGTYTFDNNGESVTFDPYLVKVTANDDGTYDFQDATGGVIATIETAASTNLFDDSLSKLGVTNVQDAIDALQTIINSNKGDITTDEIINVDVHQEVVLKPLNISVNDESITTDKIKDGTIGLHDLAEGREYSVLTTDMDGRPSWRPEKEFVQENQQTSTVVGASNRVSVNAETTGRNTEYSIDVVESELVLNNQQGNLDVNKLEPGEEGQILVTQSNEVIWVEQPVQVTANNGLTMTETSEVKLGGTLTENTVVETSGNTIAITGLQQGNTSNIEQVKNGTATTSPQPDQLVVMSEDGVLKTAKSAMPKFFYMPSVLIETVDPGDGINLYAKYIEQFTGEGLISSAGAPAEIPHLPAATDLYYYITYYDSNVFTNLTVSETGVLDFDLVAEPSVTQHSFMNIVFVIKE